MPLFGRPDLQELIAPHQAPCVSFFLPTHRHPPQRDQDPVRFRNLLRSAESRVAAAGFPDAAGLLEPVAELADRGEWGPPLDGLAVFRSPEFFAHHSLPMTLPERLVVADTFHVRPLLRFLESSERYYVLALSQNQVRLFEGTPSSLSLMEPGLPVRSLEDALGAEHDERFLNVRSAGRGGEGTLYHGHGDAEGAREEDLRRFFRVVDSAAWKLLREERAPLILAGIGRYVPLYRELSRYPFVAERGIEGNVDDLDGEQLRQRARPLLDALFSARRQEQLEELAVARGRGRAALDLESIGRHAVQGRVRRLFLSEGSHLRGRLDRETGEIHEAAANGEPGDDVLDDVAEAVLARDGEVTTLPAEAMPGGAPAAALLRW